jgi:hypothetical protein
MHDIITAPRARIYLSRSSTFHVHVSQTMTDSKAILIVGGPSRGTRFRPLSLDVPKVLHNQPQV